MDNDSRIKDLRCDEVFPDSCFQDSPCVCAPAGEGCACGHEERALRNITNRTWPHGPMTPKQRAWCVQEADSAGEGSYDPADLVAQSDRDLAADTLQAWNDYVRSHF